MYRDRVADTVFGWPRRLGEQPNRAKGSGPGKECGTEGCTNDARWIPISEGNKGSRVYRCTNCCDSKEGGGAESPSR